MQCLPQNINLNNLSFPDDQWYGFSDDQRNAITALRRLRGNGQSARRTEVDDLSSLGASSTGRGNERQIFQLMALPQIPDGPAPNVTQGSTAPTAQNNTHNHNDDGNTNSGGSIRSTQAGNAFGRN